MASIGQKLKVNDAVEATNVLKTRNLINALLPEIEAETVESLRVKQRFLETCTRDLATICVTVASSMRRGGKILIFGNGGSAADAQHICAEFVGRFQLEREALPALSLTANTSTLTAVANDYGFEEVFARQIAAFGNRDDVAIGISTSGNSRNVLNGLATARERGLLAVGFTGEDGGELKRLADLCLLVPSRVTARIQECHILAGHILSKCCEQMLTKGRGTKGPKGQGAEA